MSFLAFELQLFARELNDMQAFQELLCESLPTYIHNIVHSPIQNSIKMEVLNLACSSKSLVYDTEVFLALLNALSVAEALPSARDIISRQRCQP